MNIRREGFPQGRFKVFPFVVWGIALCIALCIKHTQYMAQCITLRENHTGKPSGIDVQ